MINIGKEIETNEDIGINLQNLIATRLLIQANAGGGKSWLIRRILEQSHGKVQQIVIDLEGEFSTLREKYDYLLVGADGEIPANIRTAELLAKRLMELRVSTIIDLSELKHHERILFVKRFLDALINLPKKLWRPCLFLIDEAHQFCPQVSKCESTGSVIDLMTRGRKRGYCGILATQRISKLHKDACAETNNRLIGRTGLDIDRKRASEELGFTKKEDEISLRHLKPGQFYAFGSSISEKIIKVKVGGVKTKHPEAGKGGIIKASSTPDNIKRLLKDVIDLPKEAEEELRTVNDYKNKVMELKRQVRILGTSKPKPEIDEKQLQRAMEQGFNKGKSESQNDIKGLQFSAKKLLDKLNKINQMSSTKTKVAIEELYKTKKLASMVALKNQTLVQVLKPIKSLPPVPEPSILSDDETALGLCEKKIYSLICQYPEKVFSKRQLGVFTGYAHTSGSFGNSIRRLITLGLIEKNGDSVKLLNIDNSLIGDFNFSKEVIISNLGKCEKEIYEILLENPDQEFSREELAEQTPSQYTGSSGSFGNSLGRLKTFGLIQRKGDIIKLNPELLEI